MKPSIVVFCSFRQFLLSDHDHSGSNLSMSVEFCWKGCQGCSHFFIWQSLKLGGEFVVVLVQRGRNSTNAWLIQHCLVDEKDDLQKEHNTSVKLWLLTKPFAAGGKVEGSWAPPLAHRNWWWNQHQILCLQSWWEKQIRSRIPLIIINQGGNLILILRTSSILPPQIWGKDTGSTAFGFPSQFWRPKRWIRPWGISLNSAFGGALWFYIFIWRYHRKLYF